MDPSHTQLLSTLISDFEARIDELSRVTEFRNEVSDPAVQQHLKDTSSNVRILETKITDARKHFAAQREELRQVQSLIAISDRQRAHLEHIQSHLPARLPGPASPEKRARPAANPKKDKDKDAPRKRTARGKIAAKVPQMPYITKGELEGVPDYLRGRNTLDSINNGVDCVRETLQTKYSLMAIPWSKLSEVQMKKYTMYKDQETDDTEGIFFFTDADFRATASGGPLDTATGVKNITQILRHLGRLKMVTASGLVRYSLTM